MDVDKKNIESPGPRVVKQSLPVKDAVREFSGPASTENTELDGEERLTSARMVAIPVQPRKSWNFISNHWRGLYSLGTSYWLFGFIASIVAALGILVIHSLFATDDGYQPIPIFFTLVCVWLFVAILTLWQLVGVWRSANRNHEQNRLVGRRASWSRAAKFMVVTGLLRTLANFAQLACHNFRRCIAWGSWVTPTYQIIR